MVSIPDSIFARNMNFGGTLQYDLEVVHGAEIANVLFKISDNLMIDSQILSVCLRATAAFHEDESNVFLANVPQRGKSINEYTLLIASMGTGKSLIFSKIMEVHQLKRQFDLKIEENRLMENGKKIDKTVDYRHAILNEITGPGLTKYLDSAGNVFVLIDEFDGDHEKIGLFCSSTKTNNLNSSAAGVLKSFHSGLPFFQKGKVSDNGHIKNPQVSFLAASNGAPIMDIIRAKMKSLVVADALVTRTVFEIIDSPPKFNSNYKNKFLSPDSIGLNIFLLASSLLCNQTYNFDTEGSQSADQMLQDWQDMCVASGARWKRIDQWIGGRFAKTSELTARLAVQLTHIDIVYNLLKDFINQNQLTDVNGPVSFNTYCNMMAFFYAKFPPYSTKPIIISREYMTTIFVMKISQVEAAIYVTKISLLKYFNLFNINIQTGSPIDEIPWIPPSTNDNSNLAVVPIPATQISTVVEETNTSAFDLYQTILQFPSICFTFTQIVTKYGKLKYRYKSIESVLDQLIAMKLLSKVKDGLRSGRNICDLYIKSLPTSITLNTVNTFIKDNLDPIKMPWTLYKSSCERVFLPSPASILSQEVQNLFNETNYSRIIERYETDIQKARKKKQSSTTTNQHQEYLNNNNNNKMHSFVNVNTSSLSSNENVFETDVQDENREQQAVESEVLTSPITSHSALASINGASSIIMNATAIESSPPPSSINYLLPRPPSQILRSSANAIIDQILTDLVSNTEFDSSYLLVDNEENLPTFASLPEPIDETQTNVRRSSRP
ncbi:unnamed protein product, partial [Adineta steineri]